jgi:hypothetical protein
MENEYKTSEHGQFWLCFSLPFVSELFLERQERLIKITPYFTSYFAIVVSPIRPLWLRGKRAYKVVFRRINAVIGNY